MLQQISQVLKRAVYIHYPSHSSLIIWKSEKSKVGNKTKWVWEIFFPPCVCTDRSPSTSCLAGGFHSWEQGHVLLSLQQLLWGTRRGCFPFGFLNLIRWSCAWTAPSKCSEKLTVPLNSLTPCFFLHSKHLDSHHPLPACSSQAEVLL